MVVIVNDYIISKRIHPARHNICADVDAGRLRREAPPPVAVNNFHWIASSSCRGGGRGWTHTTPCIASLSPYSAAIARTFTLIVTGVESRGILGDALGMGIAGPCVERWFLPMSILRGDDVSIVLCFPPGQADFDQLRLRISGIIQATNQAIFGRKLSDSTLHMR